MDFLKMFKEENEPLFLKIRPFQKSKFGKFSIFFPDEMDIFLLEYAINNSMNIFQSGN